MHNKITHYQTSFRVSDPDGKAMKRLKSTVYGWVARKETDPRIVDEKKGFFFRCNWQNLYQTRSMLCTNTHLSSSGDAWAVHYVEIDKGCGYKRFWHSDIGLKKDESTIIVSVWVSYAWNTEDLSHDADAPKPSVPRVVRYILQGNHVFSGRPEYRLLQTPLAFSETGQGKALCDFIQSADRRYPLVVFNGDSAAQIEEANNLARELSGKCMVAVIATNNELAEEIREFLPSEYRIPFGHLRVFFPFTGRRNSSFRHRWYDIHTKEYDNERNGIVIGLLRNHILLESRAVETVEEIRRLVARDELTKVKLTSPDQQKQLDEFLEEHTLVARDRDNFKQEASAYAAEIDRLEAEVGRLEWRCKDYQARMDSSAKDVPGSSVSKVFSKLPENLADVAKAAGRAFPRLVITNNALRTSQDFHDCKCLGEAWEMLLHLSETLHPLKFELGETDLEGKFKAETGFDLAMSEGKMTKDDSELMRLRELQYEGKLLDITPHVKHGNREPKLLRIHFAFEEDTKKIVVGHIGRHIPNYTTKKM